MSPQFVVVHGAGQGGTGRALQQFQQAREFEAEARRREGEYQLNRKLAEAQLKIAEQAPELRAAQDQREQESLDIAQRNQALGEREFELRAAQAEQEQTFNRKRIEALDREVSQEEAAQVFNSLRATGVNPEALKVGLSAAAKALGGGLGSAVQMLATATPSEAQVFHRLSPEYQNRYLVDMAEERVKARMEMRRDQGLQLATQLEETEVLSPEDGQAVREALASAESPEDVNTALEALYGARRSFTVKATREARRGRLLGRLEKQIAGLDESEVPASLIETLERIRAELVTDPDPNWDKYQERMGSVFGGGGGDVRDELPMPDLSGRAQPEAAPAQQEPAPAAPPQEESAAPEPTEAEAVALLSEAGIDPRGDMSDADREEAQRILDSVMPNAQKAAEEYMGADGREDQPPLHSVAKKYGVPARLVSRLVKEQADTKADTAAVARYGRTAMRKMRDVDSSLPDGQIVTEMVKRKIAPTREMATRALEYMRSNGW